jgi:prepilin-type N-terminal cleavage/methylation domain-containing protein
MKRAFTLIELLVVIAIIAILAAILFPVFAQVKQSAYRATCLSNMRQIGLGMALYISDTDDRLPDRRDLKVGLPGGWKPWTTWPRSDPRTGWAGQVLYPYTKSWEIWSCPSVSGSPMKDVIQVAQAVSNEPGAPVTRYWMWPFDRPSDPVLLDNFWGKSPDQAAADTSTDLGREVGVSQVELLNDPYFPRTARGVDMNLAGINAHRGGFNRLHLDLHAKWIRDVRLNQ